MSEEAGKNSEVLRALGKSGGRVTVGDIVAATGLSSNDAETSLRQLLETHEGHLEVSEDGDLVYLFDPKLARRDMRTGWQRAKETTWRGFKAGFKVWIMLMLVVYFVIYVALAIAAFAALMSQNRSSSSSRAPRIPLHWLFYLFWAPDWHYGSRYYGERRRSVSGVPFYKKVFAFVFGPDERTRSESERRASLASFIRSHRGVLSASELVEHTGERLMDADSAIGRVLSEFEGDVRVSDSGQLAYTFPELMLSTDRSSSRRPEPAWRQLEPMREVTGNKTKANAAIIGVNAFNLIFGLLSPVALFPILGITGTAAMVGLVYVPLVFSVLFFAVPAVRSRIVHKENARRRSKNARRLLLKPTFEGARAGAVLRSSEMKRAASQHSDAGESDIETALESVVSDFDAEIDANSRGELTYSFTNLGETLTETEQLREKLKLDQRRVGEIVFASADDSKQAEAREMREFERELADVEEVEESEMGSS